MELVGCAADLDAAEVRNIRLKQATEKQQHALNAIQNGIVQKSIQHLSRVNVHDATVIRLSQENQTLTESLRRMMSMLHKQQEAMNSREQILFHKIAELSKESALHKIGQARTRVALEWAQTKAEHDQKEVVELLQCLQIVGQHGASFGDLRHKLERAQAHIRLLEDRLDPSTIAAALLEAQGVSVSDPSIPITADLPSDAGAVRLEGGYSDALFPEPNNAMQVVAPEMHALLTLRHRTMTITDLLREWQEQALLVERLRKDVTASHATIDKLQYDGTRAFHLYQQEHARRVSCERRMMEFSRRRVAKLDSDAAIEELSAIRTDYALKQDEVAMLSVDLEMVKETLRRTENDRNALQQALKTLEDRLHGDAVVECIQRCKLMYEQHCNRLQSMFMANAEAATIARLGFEKEAQTRKALEQRLSEQRTKMEQAVHQLNVPHVGNHAARTDTLTQLKALASSELQRVSKALEGLSSHRSDCDHHGTAAQQLLEELKKVLSVAKSRWEATLQSYHRDAVAPDISQLREQNAPVQQLQLTEALQRCTSSALRFAMEQTSSTDALRGSFIDNAMADGEALIELAARYRTVVEERDAAIEELRKSQALIEKCSLVVAEKVVMHGIQDNGVDEAVTVEEVHALRAQLDESAQIRAALEKNLSTLRGVLRQKEQELALSRIHLQCSAVAVQKSREEQEQLRRNHETVTASLISAQRQINALADVGAGPRMIHQPETDPPLSGFEEETLDHVAEGLSHALTVLKSIRKDVIENDEGSVTPLEHQDGGADRISAAEVSEDILEDRLRRKGLASIVALIHDISASSDLLRQVRMRSMASGDAKVQVAVEAYQRHIAELERAAAIRQAELDEHRQQLSECRSQLSEALSSKEAALREYAQRARSVEEALDGKGRELQEAALKLQQLQMQKDALGKKCIELAERIRSIKEGGQGYPAGGSPPTAPERLDGSLVDAPIAVEAPAGCDADEGTAAEER
jgi:hypothetical protein